MHVITEKEELKEYSLFMDKVSYCLLINSQKNVAELMEKDPNVVAADFHEELGNAVGQIVYDKIIELTKDMSRKQIVKYLAQTASATALHVMNNNEEYRNKIAVIGPFLDMLP